MIKVGITGGIGSGKSTVCKKFEDLGIPVFDSDSHAKAYYGNADVKHKLVDLFGIKIIHNNEVDKRQLAQMIFSDATKLDSSWRLLSRMCWKISFFSVSIINKNPIAFLKVLLFMSESWNKCLIKLLS